MNLDQAADTITELLRRPDLTENENGQLRVTLKFIQRVADPRRLLIDRIEDQTTLDEMLVRVRLIKERFNESNIIIFGNRPRYEDDPEAVDPEQRMAG